LVDGPNFTRQLLNIKSLHLTKFLLKIQHSARKASVLKAWNKFEVDKKWGASKWAQRLAAQQTRANLTDFERFKLMRAKQAVMNQIE
jgi:large subunit ribosomal protein L14e